VVFEMDVLHFISRSGSKCLCVLKVLGARAIVEMALAFLKEVELDLCEA